MQKVVVVTQQGVDAIATREKEVKAALGNYECPICKKYIWWDESHEHKLGQTVRF